FALASQQWRNFHHKHPWVRIELHTSGTRRTASAPAALSSATRRARWMDDPPFECDGGSTATSTRILPWKSCALSAADTCELQKVIVKNRSETMKLSPRSFPTAKGWCFARTKHA